MNQHYTICPITIIHGIDGFECGHNTIVSAVLTIGGSDEDIIAMIVKGIENDERFKRVLKAAVKQYNRTNPGTKTNFDSSTNSN